MPDPEPSAVDVHTLQRLEEAGVDVGAEVTGTDMAHGLWRWLGHAMGEPDLLLGAAYAEAMTALQVVTVLLMVSALWTVVRAARARGEGPAAVPDAGRPLEASLNADPSVAFASAARSTDPDLVLAASWHFLAARVHRLAAEPPSPSRSPTELVRALPPALPDRAHIADLSETYQDLRYRSRGRTLSAARAFHRAVGDWARAADTIVHRQA